MFKGITMKTTSVIAIVCVSISVTILLTNYFIKNQNINSEQQLVSITNSRVPNQEKAIPSKQQAQPSAIVQSPNSPKTDTTIEIQSSKYTTLQDHQSINNLFFNEQGVLDSDTITTILSTDMLEFIEHANQLPLDNELANERFGQLTQQLSTLSNNYVFSQQLACAGKVCALSLITNELTAENQTHLANFGSNISFTSNKANEAGELEFKAIYVHYEDPSTLVMTTP